MAGKFPLPHLGIQAVNKRKKPVRIPGPEMKARWPAFQIESKPPCITYFKTKAYQKCWSNNKTLVL